MLAKTGESKKFKDTMPPEHDMAGGIGSKYLKRSRGDVVAMM
jgi:hypothetical protein